jgi:hypothetical protein
MTKYSMNPIVRMKAMKSMIALMLLLTSVLAPMVHAQSGPYSVRIENVSSYSIREVHMSWVGDNNWGPDLLGRSTLSPAYAFTKSFYTGLYDLKLVDEDGDVCIVPRVAVNGPTSWRITNSWLLNCEFH